MRKEQGLKIISFTLPLKSVVEIIVWRHGRMDFSHQKADTGSKGLELESLNVPCPVSHHRSLKLYVEYSKHITQHCFSPFHTGKEKVVRVSHPYKKVSEKSSNINVLF